MGGGVDESGEEACGLDLDSGDERVVEDEAEADKIVAGGA